MINFLYMTSVTNMVWGEVTASDGNKYKDCIVRYDGSRIWNWNHDGTRHDPGITVKAIQNIMDCDVIILSRGYQLVLKVTPEALAVLKSRTHHICQSQEAVILYNKLAKSGIRVGMLLHSTC